MLDFLEKPNSCLTGLWAKIITQTAVSEHAAEWCLENIEIPGLLYLQALKQKVSESFQNDSRCSQSKDISFTGKVTGLTNSILS